MVLSIPSDSPLYDAGANDRILMTDSTEPFDTVLTHTGNEILPGRIVSVDRVFWLIGQGQSVIEGTIPRQAPDGALIWRGNGSGSACIATEAGIPIVSDHQGALIAEGLPFTVGTQYTIAGRRNPEFYVFQDLPQDRAHFHGARLPRRVAVRRFDLFGR